MIRAAMILAVVCAGWMQARLVERTKPIKQRTVHIRGTVRDANGQPMSGVTVTATTE